MEPIPVDASLDRAALDNLAEGVVVHDATGRIVSVNRAAMEFLGLSVELTGRTWVDPGWPAVHEDGSTFAGDENPAMVALSTGAAVTDVVMGVQHASGETRWLVVNARPLHRGSGDQVTGAVASFRDVTERRNADGAGLLAHARFRRFVDANIIGIVVADADGHVVEANDYYLDLLGVTRDEYDRGTLDWRAFTPPEWLPADERAIAELRERGVCSPYEKEYLRRDGRRVPVLIADALMPDPTHEIGAFVLDITDRKRAEEVLRQSEQEFHTLAEAMPQMVWTTRPDGWNTYVNQRWTEYTGLTLEESHGEGWSIPFHPEDRERAQEAWRQATATGRTYEIEVRLRRADGIYRWWLVRGAPIRDAGGAITTWVGTCTDVDDLRQARSGVELSAANYDALFDTTLLGIAHGEIVLDEQGRPVDYRYLRVNSTFEELTGLARADVVGRTMREIAPGFEDSAFDFIGAHGQVALTGEPVEFEQYQEHVGRWYSVHVYSPRPGQFISMFSDITERKRDEEALRESEYLFAASQRAAHVGTWSRKVGDSTTYWSDETYRIYGLSPEMGPPSNEFFFEIVHPDDRQKTREFPAAIIAGLQPPPFDCRVRRSDGTYRWIRTAGDVVETVHGVPSRIAGTAYDVTERKHAEEQLAQRTRLYATLSQVNQAIVRVKQPVELYQSICDVAVEFGEFALAWVGLYHEDSGDVRPVAAHGVDVARWPFEIVNIHTGVWKDGLVATAIRSREVAFTGDIGSDEELRSVLGQTEGRDYRAIAAIPFGPDGKPVGVLVLVSQREGLFEEASEVGLLQEMGHDISFALDSMTTETALRESEEQLERIGEMAKFGGWELDLQTLEVRYSRETARIHEVDWPYIPPKLSQGSEYYPPEAWPIVQAAVQAAIEHGTPYDLESPFITARGRHIWVRIQGSRVMQDGKAIKLQGSFQDITERKAAETARAALQAQLDQAQKMESVGRLAGGVAHDFNNMLAVIMGNTDLALEALGPSHPVRADLLEVREAAGRSSQLTRQLLAFARREAAAPRVVDLNVLVSAMLDLLRRLIGEDIDLVWKPGHDLWPVFVDPSQVDQVLTNLVVNARDAISDIGMISIETGIATLDAASVANQPDALPGDYVVLTVSDTGSGMDAETMAHMYEPFFTTKESGKGTGLGLATAYGIASQNGGFLIASSEVGVGTTLRIYLPRHIGRLVPTATRAPSTGDRDGGETVLLVEDEPALLRLSAVMLERLGYRVIAAATPGEALALAREHPGEIHLLMTDVVMPQMNGRDLARNLQSLFPNLRRLFMSGYTADVIAHHGVLAEDVHFLQKPFSMSDLNVKVREALDAVPASGDPPAG